MAVVLSCTRPYTLFRCTLNTAGGGGGGGGKHAQRLLSSLHASSSSVAADRIVQKFLTSSSKSAALQTLSHLLSRSSSFAIPIYRGIRGTDWFRWNPKLAAAVIALLEKDGHSGEAETLTLESTAALHSPRDLALFYCDLIDALSEQGLKQQSLNSQNRLRGIPFSSRRTFECMIKGLSLIGMPSDAEDMLEEMVAAGFRPSPFEFRSVMQGYGRMGLFDDMRRVLGRIGDAGFAVDTVCANIVLSCYGEHGELSEMVSWLRRMRELGIDCSFRTFNSVLNSCPMVVSLMQDVRSLPLSIESLVEKLEEDVRSDDEALLIKELINSRVLFEIMEWSPLEGKLDLHGFHSASAYMTVLHWMDELRLRFRADNVVPVEISIVCGLGKHSSKRGESPIKMLVSELMFQLKSPMRIDRKNAGRFVAKGKAVNDWLR